MAIELLHRLVEQGAEHPCIKRFRNVIWSLETEDRSIVELRRTIEISLKAGSGESPAVQRLDVRLRLRDCTLILPSADGRLGHIPSDIHSVVEFELLDVTALLPCLDALCPRIEEHPHVGRPLDEPIEIICPHCILMLVCRQVVTLTEFRRDKG